MQLNQREKQGKSSQILKSSFRGAPHIHRHGFFNMDSVPEISLKLE